MKRLFLLLLLTGCAGNAVLDAELRATAAAEMARRPAHYTNGEARSWVIRRDGAERGMLWGTLHIGYGSETVLPAPIRARFADAADLTVEVAIDRMPRGEFLAMVETYRAANTKADPEAFRRLDPGTRQAVLDAVAAGDTGRYSLRGLAGQVAARAVAEPPGLLPTGGFVDLNLIGFARAQNHPVFGLERPQDIDPTVKEPNGEDAAALLRRALRRSSDLRGMNAWVRSTYGRGEVAPMYSVLVAWRASPADLVLSDRDRVPQLERRNAAWIPLLDRRLGRPGFHFIAVGAAHLLGDDGLVSLLRARGYEVTPCVGDVCR